MIAVVAVAVLVDCGGSTPTPAGPGAPASAFPVTVEHRSGATTIEAEPHRVVTVGYTDQDPVIALGGVPVGTTEWYGTKPGALYPWARGPSSSSATSRPRTP